MLKDVASVNSFESDTSLAWTEGDELDIYFQLVDSSLDKHEQGFNPGGRRYVPAASSTLQVTVESVDDAKVITRYATQPFAQDGSIWKFSVYAADTIRGSPQVRLTLTEPIDQNTNRVTRGVVKGALKVSSQTNC